MNRSFWFSVILAFFSCTSFSQVLIGPVAGVNVGWIAFDEKENKDLYQVKPVVGFHAGASIAFRVQKRFFLQTSFLYAQKGKSLEGKVDPMFSNETTYRYIDVPILYTAEFKAKLKNGKVYKWYLGAGPTISYWLGGKGLLNHSDLNENTINPPTYDLPYTITFGNAPEDVKQGDMNVQYPNRLQLGLNVSAGLILEPMGLDKIMVTARYHAGHSFLSRDSKGDYDLEGILYYEDDLRIRHREFVLSLYYLIDLKTAERNKGKSTIKLKKGRPRR